MTCAAEMGCSDSIIKFVMPLGATVNMSGTALYEATTVIFIAQVGCISAGNVALCSSGAGLPVLPCCQEKHSCPPAKKSLFCAANLV